jgi:peptidoglycan/LPS O-acetylase OafA/YrhL
MPWSYRPALDGLRTIAVYLVVLFHSGLSFAGGGFIGVDLFFVLSGFLITNVLLSDVDESGRIRFGRFYSRRVRRLLPAAVVTVAATSFVFLLITTVVRRLDMVGDAQSALLYVANWHFMSAQNDYFATAVDKSPFLHFWSLGIEEQFYVAFPLLLLLLTRLGRRRPWAPTAGIAGFLVLSLIAQVYWASADPSHAYYGTDARVYQLLAGSLLACVLRQWPVRVRVVDANRAALAALVGLLLLGTNLFDIGVSARGVAAAAASTVLIGALTVTDGGTIDALLSRRTPVYLGQVSYSTYLWHWPVILVIRELVTIGPLALAAITIGVATGLAALSYELLEMPIRRSPRLGRARWATVVAGVVVAALVAGAVVPPVLESTRRPKLAAAGKIGTGKALTGTQDRVKVPDLDWAALADANGPSHTCPADDPQACVVVRGSGPHILLVGDSHARMLVPVLTELAEEHDLTLSINAISGCPWQAKLQMLYESPEKQAACIAARDTWYREALPALHPDVVLLAGYTHADVAEYGKTIRRTGGSSESLHELLMNTTFETLDRITAEGSRALILRDILTVDFEPLDCLARATYVDQCSVPVPLERPVTDDFYATADVQSPDVYTFDINPVACPRAPLCSAIIAGINVWRDFNHYSTQILSHFRAKVWKKITASGAISDSG